MDSKGNSIVMVDQRSGPTDLPGSDRLHRAGRSDNAGQSVDPVLAVAVAAGRAEGPDAGDGGIAITT